MIVIESVNSVGITVSDLERAVSFYRELFDFDVIEKLSSAGQAYLKMGEIVIALNEKEGFSSSADSGYIVSFFVDEDDFDDIINEFAKTDVKIVYGPENIRNGRSLIFTDPDGNRIELAYPKI